MPTTEPSLRDALSQAVKQTPKETPAALEPGTPSTPDLKDEQDGLSGYDRELLADLQEDLSAMDEPTRKRLEPLILKFRKPYDKAFHRSKEDALLGKRVRETVAQRPTSFEKLKAILDGREEADSPKPVLTPEQKTSLRGIDKLIDEATDPAIKENLRQSKRVILEEMDSQVEGLLKPMRDELKSLRGEQRSVRMSSVLTEVDRLEDELGYPPAMVEKYREQLVGTALNYPGVSMEEILWKTVPLSELKPVVSKEKREPKAGTRPLTGSVSTPKAQPSDTLSKFTNKQGELNIRGALRSLLGKS